jgi:hypothetical protein
VKLHLQVDTAAADMADVDAECVWGSTPASMPMPFGYHSVFDRGSDPTGSMSATPTDLWRDKNVYSRETATATPTGGNGGILEHIQVAWAGGAQSRIGAAGDMPSMPLQGSHKEADLESNSDHTETAASRSSNMGHCSPLYVHCQHLNGGKLLRNGKRCEDCFNMCTLNGSWPYQYCPLPGY